MRNGRLTATARRTRGIIKLVKYGNGCFVRCACLLERSKPLGEYEDDLGGHSAKYKGHC